MKIKQNKMVDLSKDTKYSFLKKTFYEYNDYQLVPLRFNDIQIIKNWRNEQLTILRQKNIISADEQLLYYEKIIKKSFTAQNPEQILFSFLMNKKCIGYGGLVHIDWKNKSAELSFLNETARSLNEKIFSIDFKIFLRLIFEITFSELKLNEIITEAFDIRQNLIKLLEDMGFVFDKKKKDYIIINGITHDSIFHKFDKKSYIDFIKKVNLNEN